MTSKALLSVALLVAAAIAQPGPGNTNQNCGVTTDYNYGGTLYYNPNDSDDFGAYLKGSGCDAGSYGAVTLNTPSGGTVNCGYLALNGASNLVNCPNYPRGSSSGGGYQFNIDIGWAEAYSPFTITHTQQTVTATSSFVATNTEVDTTTVTTTVTNTDTFTSSQITVTSPSSTVTNTVTVTPSSTKTTVISTTTYTATFKSATAVVVTSTTTICPAASPATHQCQIKSKKLKRVDEVPKIRGRLQLVRRDVPNGGEGNTGDGPLTVTTTYVSSSTTTITTTATISTTSYAPDVTTTIANPTPTTTVYSGVAVTTTTKTLAQVTKTRTRYSVAFTKTTIVSTYTYTAKATAPCKR